MPYITEHFLTADGVYVCVVVGGRCFLFVSSAEI